MELGVEPQLLDDPRVFTRSETRIVLGLGSSDNHFSGREDQSGSLGVSDTHDDGCETLFTEATSSVLSHAGLDTTAVIP